MRYVIESLWAIPATATGYLVSGIFFGERWDNWVWLLMLHVFATIVGITSGPPLYRRWFMRDE